MNQPGPPDPLLIAGYTQCWKCGQPSYPTDAAWVGALILATYAPPCKHTVPMTWVVDPTHLDEPQEEFCGALTRSGDPCRNRTNGSRCHHHRAADRRRR